MNAYQLTIVLPEKITSAKKKTIVDTIEKIVKLNKGEVKKLEDWGEIELSYKIAKNTTGNFLQFILELKKSSVRALDDKLKMEEGIIRYLLVANNQ